MNSHRSIDFIKVLGGVGGATSDALQEERIQGHPKDDAASMLVESAEGITTFPGLNGDDASRIARAFINRRLGEIADEHQQSPGADRQLSQRPR
jgi:hypothetical protein